MHYFLYFRSIFILLSRESDHSAIPARLEVANHLSTTPRWGNPDKCLSQRHNQLTCRLDLHTIPLMLSVKQRNCEYQFQSRWFDRFGIKPESTAPEANALATRHLSCQIAYEKKKKNRSNSRILELSNIVSCHHQQCMQDSEFHSLYCLKI